jgi:anaerobic magnesium-protoporphyrin IX monomethyl ester cyclase
VRALFLFFTDPPRAFSSSVAALAGVVRTAGHEPLALEVHRKQRIADVASTMDALAPDLLGVATMTRDWPGARALLERIACDPYIVVGGYHASLAPRDVAACERVHAIAIGEGERPLRTLLDLLPQTRPRSSFPGLWVKNGDWSDPVPGADPEPDIVALPPWDYDVFGDMPAILRTGVNTFGPHVDRYLPTRAGRGCPFTCAYCSAPRWGKLQDFAARDKRNIRPVADLCDEHERLRDRYEPEGFEFWDEHFPISIEWLRELAREYPRRVGRPFKVEMHPSAANRERLELLVAAGCKLFHCGIESGDEGFRHDVLNRRTPDARLQQLFDDCRELGLATSASLMTMLPGETRAQTRSTTDLLHRLQPGSFMWSTYHPLPGTVLGDAAVGMWPGPARECFDDYDDVLTRTPARVSDTERADTFRELADLQSSLVQIASRHRAEQTRARPVEIPVPKRPAPLGLAKLLGLAPPEARLDGPRINTASFERGELTLEIEHPAFAPHEVRLAPRDGSRHFIEAGRVGLSYRGRTAPHELLRTLRAMAEHLGETDIDALRRALEP